MSVAAGISVERPRRRPRALRRLLVDAGGFGIVELLIALMVLNIGIFATIAAFNSGMVTLRRASRTATASSIAERQMELYRALSYDSIVLSPPGGGETPLDATYQGDAQWAGSMDMVPCPQGTQLEACKPVQIVSGADGNEYRLDTYMHKRVETTGTYSGREVKIVAVVVRDTRTPALAPIVRMESTFDRSTGA